MVLKTHYQSFEVVGTSKNILTSQKYTYFASWLQILVLDLSEYKKHTNISYWIQC